MYTVTGKAPARSARPGMEVTLYTSTSLNDALEAKQFFCLHYDDINVIHPKLSNS